MRVWSHLLIVFLLSSSSLAQTTSSRLKPEDIQYGLGDGLLRDPIVRRELRFTAAQQRVLFEANRRVEAADIAARLKRNRDYRLGLKVDYRMRPMLQDIQAVDNAILATLSPSQKARLQQLSYQWMGPICYSSIRSFPAGRYNADVARAARLDHEIWISLQQFARDSERRLGAEVERLRSRTHPRGQNITPRGYQGRWGTQLEEEAQLREKYRRELWRDSEAYLKAHVTKETFEHYLRERGPFFPYIAFGKGSPR